MYVEGLVHITELGGEYFRFDEARQELRGERTGIRYAIGTRVRIQVSRVDLDGRKIDFRLVQEGVGAVPKLPPEKGAGRDSKSGRGDFAGRAEPESVAFKGKVRQQRSSSPASRSSRLSEQASPSAKKAAKKRR
jgi:ribonuclease R